MWQRGPWLLVDRAAGHVTPLKLPDYDPGVSQVSWFRDYAAYCGLTPSGKSLYAVVAQVAVRKPVLAKRLAAFDPEDRPEPVCAAPEWQRSPLRVISIQRESSRGLRSTWGRGRQRWWRIRGRREHA